MPNRDRVLGQWGVNGWMRVTAMAVALACMTTAAVAAPINVYLTYQGDTSRSITVNYHLEVRMREVEADPTVHYDTVSRNGEPSRYASKVSGRKYEMPYMPVYRTLNAVELGDLEPDTVYYFVAGDPESGYTEERSFKTAPAGNEPIRFVTGGDMNVTPLASRLLAEAGKQDPLFCAIGGDIAYVNGQVWRYETWDLWFQNYDTHLRTPDGRMVPMLVGIGNHETNGLPSTDPVIRAPFYHHFFALNQSDGKTYFTRQFGTNILFILLDTGHVVPHGGEQSAWLAETLAANATMLYTFAMYHVPLYPSHRPFDGAGSVAGRVHWEPYFSAYRITAGLENHDHKLKRAKLMLNGQPDDDGVLYIGDGCFGVDPRHTDDGNQRSYLEHNEPAGHIWVVDVDEDGVHYRALGDTGQLLDEYRQPVRPREETGALAAP